MLPTLANRKASVDRILADGGFVVCRRQQEFCRRWPGKLTSPTTFLAASAAHKDIAHNIFGGVGYSQRHRPQHFWRRRRWGTTAMADGLSPLPIIRSVMSTCRFGEGSPAP
jgi:hypothetical protein